MQTPDRLDDLKGKHIVLGLSGGIACYKSAELVRALTQAGASVQVVMTEAACQFITPVTMQALSGQPVVLSQWDAREPNNMAHINLSREADAILVAPASADFIAQLVQGRANDLLALLCLARPIASCPLLLAPAMNREMWDHPATRRNCAQAVADGATLLGPGSGSQACGETGDGRMLEAAELCEDLIAFFQPKLPGRAPGADHRRPHLRGHRSGARHHQPQQRQDGFCHRPRRPRGRRRRDPGGRPGAPAHAARRAPHRRAERPADARCRAAAGGAAWRVHRHRRGGRLAPRHAVGREDQEGRLGPGARHGFTENPDILAAVARLPGGPYCVGFAAESHDLARHAREKRLRKGVPLIVGNVGPATFGRDDNTLLLVDEHGEHELPTADKLTLARALVADIAQRLEAA
jgi:phosphopantothenoylcysteine decarboxylase/phosphopantothenate--cysteine ligase